MSLPPEDRPPGDLPRSPTGRVPQWVRDEAAVRADDPPQWVRDEAARLAAEPPPWRGPTSTTTSGYDGYEPWRPVPRRGIRGSVIVAWLVPFVVVLLLLGRWVDQTYGGGTAPVVAYELEHTLDTPHPPFELSGVPRPYDESPEPLGVPPRPADGNAPHEFLQTWTGADGLPVPVAWSPCRPIHYVIDPTDAPADFADRVAAVFAEVSVATGLVFRDDGFTTEAATSPREPYQPGLYGDRWAPALIRFADGDTIPEFTGRYSGLGGAVSVTSPTTGVPHYISGFAYLNTSLRSDRDIDGEPAYLSVLRHEVGHMIGLGHVDDREQLMYGEGNFVTQFQDGDLAGLAALGHGRCAPGV